MRIALLVTEDWYVCSHRLPLLREAVARGHQVHVLTNVRHHAGPIEATGASLEALPVDRSGVDPRRELRLVAALVRALRAFRPDVLHAVALKPVLYGTLTARAAGVPNVLNAMAGLGALFTGEDPAKRVGARQLAVRRALSMALQSRRSHVLVQNPDDRDAVTQLGARAGRVQIIRGSGVDLDAFPSSPSPPGPQVRAIFVGRLLRDKGLQELHDAAVLLRERVPELTVQVAGDRDPHNPACLDEATVERWRRDGALELLGRRDDVAHLIAGAHLAVLPSYREGLPKALLEAAAVGRAMVATDVPGCREVVQDGVTGILVPARDHRALADAMERLARDRVLRETMAAKARVMAEREFSDLVVAGATVDLYERLALP